MRAALKNAVKPRLEIKTGRELEKMRESGRIVAQVLGVLQNAVRPGITTADLECMARQEIKKRGAAPAFLNYHGYPAALCTSINEEVVHGIPAAERVLSQGDIISLDMGVVLDGYYGDAAVTVPVGKISSRAMKLMEVTKEALDRAIQAVRPGATVGDISHTIEDLVVSNGMSVVREFTGHGIGRNLHEEPQVLNYGQAGTGMVLKPGLVIAIEPMVCLGQSAVRIKENHWTAVTVDGSLSAHFEHTMAVTESGGMLLTDE